MIYQSNGHPLISVVIPVCNAQGFVGATLHSLVNQSYPHLEIIVVDDGSTDNTAQVVMDWKKRDHRIRLLQQANAGVAAARNLAIRSSRGSFIAPVDADDICYPQKVEKLLAALQRAGKQAGVAYSWSTVIDKHGNLTSASHRPKFEGDVFEDLLFGNFIGNGSAGLLRKKCLDAVGLYDTAFFLQKAQGCEDYDLFLRLSEKFEFKLVKAFCTGYRKTGNTMSNNYKAMERSHQLVFKSQKARNPWIPDIVLSWSSAYYFLWLSWLAADKGCLHDSIKYLVKAASHDWALIKNLGYWLKFQYHLRYCLSKVARAASANGNRKNCAAATRPRNTTPGKLSIQDLPLKADTPSIKRSLTALKDHQRVIAHFLVRQARIKNGHIPNPDCHMLSLNNRPLVSLEGSIRNHASSSIGKN